MALILKTRTDVEDLALGCTFFGTGGGGTMQVGLEMLYPHIDAGKKLTIIDVDTLKDDDWIACPAYSGTIAPATPEIEVLRTRFPWDFNELELKVGLEILEENLGVKFAATVPFELGGINTPAPIDAGVKHGIPCVDGDYAGRAVPELLQSTTCIKGIPMAPMALVDWYGNRTFVQHVINYEMGERISKALSEVAWGRLGNVLFPIQGSTFKDVVIPGTLSKAFDVGKAIRESRESGDDPADKIVEKSGGWILFRGEVIEKKWENREGYMWGDTLIKGSGLKPGNRLKVFFKNENHILWIDDEPWVMSPDIIEIIEAKSGEPITNTDLKKGDKVSVIGMKTVPIFRTPGGLNVLGPKHFGYDLKYTPIEEVVS
ncbi:MAG: DUF917 domain-containing protein [Candidatus Thorarchaeota archaeon]